MYECKYLVRNIKIWTSGLKKSQRGSYRVACQQGRQSTTQPGWQRRGWPPSKEIRNDVLLHFLPVDLLFRDYLQ